VSVLSAEQNSVLTDGFSDPKRLAGHVDVVARHASFVLEGAEVVGQSKALLIGPVFSPALAGFWLSVAIVTSVVTAIVVGVVSNSAATGLGVGSGLLALLTAVQALVVWLVRQF